MAMSRFRLYMYLLCFMSVGQIHAATTLDQAAKGAVVGHEQDIRSQQQVDRLHDEAQSSYEEYKAVKRQLTLVNAYNAQLEKLVASQQQELDGLLAQLDSLDKTELAVSPMLNRMVSMLEDFIEADTPFLLEERFNRVKRLRHQLDRADVSLAEKYRQILEAYLIEVDYGRTMEAYIGQVSINGENRQVNFLRIGRAALYYQSLDNRSSALWQPSKGDWQLLSDQHLPELSKAIKIAWQQSVPDLLYLPLPELESPNE